MTIEQLQREIHETAKSKGWWENPRPVPELLMLMVSELAEGLEEYRSSKPMEYAGENGKPEGLAVELADCLIRILDAAGGLDIDLQAVVERKMAYNATRPYRHGGKVA